MIYIMDTLHLILHLHKDVNKSKSKAIWNRLLLSNEFDTFDSRDQLTNLVFQGIPNELRLDIWYKFACCNMDLSEIRNQYNDLEKQFSEEANSYILRDVHRTFDCNVHNSRALHKIDTLTRILNCYAALDPNLGYTQGMNLVASFPLIFCEDEFKCFSIFYSLLQNPDLYFRDIFIDGFAGFRELVKIWIYFLDQKYPWLRTKLELNKSINLENIVLKTFISLTFALNIPLELKLIMFDRLCIFGKTSLISFHLSLLKIFSNQLQKMDEIDATDFLFRIDANPIFEDVPFIVKVWNEEWISTKEFNELILFRFQ